MESALRSFFRFLRPLDPSAAPGATRMSGRAARSTAGRLVCRAAFALARPSLCSLLAIMPAGCLVTSVPEFEEPLQTPPFLVAEAADPDVREFVLVVDGDARKEFNAAVISEDRGKPVKVALYFDYGVENAAKNPFKLALAEFPDVPPGTIADGKRPVSAQWYLDSADVLPGCHTVTMMVTHEFDFRRCPVTLADSSYLTWHIRRCTSKEQCGAIDPFEVCPNSAEVPLIQCPDKATDADAGGTQ